MNEPQRHRDTGAHGPERDAGIEIERLTPLTSRIIGAAIEVHRALGPGLLEPLYEQALCIELEERGIAYARQIRAPAFYKGRLLGEYRVDLVVDDLVIVEVKSVAIMTGVFDAQ